MTWGETETYELQCSECGAMHDVSATRFPVAERYVLNCEWCGHQMKRDRSSWDPTCSLKTPGDLKKKKAK